MVVGDLVLCTESTRVGPQAGCIYTVRSVGKYGLLELAEVGAGRFFGQDRFRRVEAACKGIDGITRLARWTALQMDVLRIMGRLNDGGK